LTFVYKGTIALRAPSLGLSGKCVNAMQGALADGRPGLLCQRLGIRGDTVASAQYEIPRLGDLIEGLWVHKSGRGLWTRVALPEGYTELTLPDDAFTARYRTAISCSRDEQAARRLLSGDFLVWLTDRAVQGGRLSPVGTDFEIRQGVLFIRGPLDAFNAPEKLDEFAGSAARIAGEVAALTNSPVPASVVGRCAWGCEICGGAAGSIELDERGEARRETFTSTLTLRMADAAAGKLQAALAAGDACAVYALDPELAPWWCPACRKSYCGDHWQRSDVFDEQEPGWHDCIRGRCPEGHERMLED
jgi:hypothetical protein